MIYLTGDVHMPIDIEKIINFSKQKNITHDDMLLITGDVGFMWSDSSYYKTWFNWFNEQVFTTMFVDGNHENFNYLDSLPISFYNDTEHSKVHYLADNIIHLMRGQIYDIDGKSFFTFGGGDSIDKHRRITNVTWWEREMPSKQEYDEALWNLTLYDNKINYIITHSCSSNLFNEINKVYSMVPYYTNINVFFDVIEDSVAYNKWYFGHYHCDMSINDRHRVLFNDIIKLGE